MQIASICELTGWMYDEYMAQPQWLIETLKIKIEIDSDNAIKQLKGLK